MAVRDEATLRAFLDEYEANVHDATGQTVTHWAASTGSVSAIDYALKQGAKLSKKDDEGRTALHIAALSGHGATVSHLLARRASAQERDRAGATPLYRAAMAGSAESVRALAAAAPSSLEKRLPRTQGTPLHAAAYLGHIPVLEALLEVGASPCARNRAGERPVDMFVEEDDDEVARIMQEPPVVGNDEKLKVFQLLAPDSASCRSRQRDGEV